MLQMQTKSSVFLFHSYVKAYYKATNQHKNKKFATCQLKLELFNVFDFYLQLEIHFSKFHFLHSFEFINFSLQQCYFHALRFSSGIQILRHLDSLTKSSSHHWKNSQYLSLYLHNGHPKNLLLLLLGFLRCLNQTFKPAFENDWYFRSHSRAHSVAAFSWFHLKNVDKISPIYSVNPDNINTYNWVFI